MTYNVTGHVTYQGDGMTVSIQAMATQMAVLKAHTDNIAHFGVPGYQQKNPIVTSFVEYLGPDGVSTVTSEEIGRLRRSGQPLDTALATPGYFQKLQKSGQVELTRDGRFKLDKDGTLLTLDDSKVLSAAGTPIRLPYIPEDPEKQVHIDKDGTLTLYDLKTGEAQSVAQLGVVSSQGTVLADVDVKQGYVEDSNVFLQREYTELIAPRRQFEANRQLFIVQSDSLSRMIQELGRAQ